MRVGSPRFSRGIRDRGRIDPELVYHPSVEESFILEGEGYLGDRVRRPGGYLYRPPGILHGPAGQPPYTSRILLQRVARGDAPNIILRYDGDEFPHADCQPVTDEYKDWPVTWVEELDSNTIPWIESESGPWQGAAYKWLSRNRITGGGTLLIEIPAGWSGEGSQTLGSLEEFVVQGRLSMGGQWFERWGYASRPAGDAAGLYQSLGGARLLCFWDENELAP